MPNPNKQGSLGDTTQQTETSVNQRNVPSAIPVAVKNGVISSTRDGISKILQTIVVSSALVAGSAPAMAEAPQNPVSLLESKGFSKESMKGVLALSNFTREQEAKSGLAPTEIVDIKSVTPISPDGTGLDQLVNTGSKLPKKTFAEVTKASALDAANYNAVVEVLFNPADIDVWLTKPDGTQMNAQEKADYKEALANTKARWLAKLPELVSTGKQDVVTRWFALFNTLAAKPVHGSREEYRRGLIAANSMAGYSALTPERQKALSSVTVTQTAEYVLMTDPKAQMIKIERNFKEPEKQFTLKYLVPSDESVKKAGFPEGAQAISYAFGKINEEQVKTYDLHAKTVTIDKRGVEVDKEAFAVKEFKALQKEAISLSAVIQEQFSQLQKRRGDPQFIAALSTNLKSWKTLKVRVDAFMANQEESRFIDEDNKITIVSLVNKILLNAQLNGLNA